MKREEEREREVERERKREGERDIRENNWRKEELQICKFSLPNFLG